MKALKNCSKGEYALLINGINLSSKKLINKLKLLVGIIICVFPLTTSAQNNTDIQHLIGLWKIESIDVINYDFETKALISKSTISISDDGVIGSLPSLDYIINEISFTEQAVQVFTLNKLIAEGAYTYQASLLFIDAPKVLQSADNSSGFTAQYLIYNQTDSELFLKSQVYTLDENNKSIFIDIITKLKKTSIQEDVVSRWYMPEKK